MCVRILVRSALTPTPTCVRRRAFTCSALDDFVWTCAGAFVREHFLLMESSVLSTLGFECVWRAEATSASPPPTDSHRARPDATDRSMTMATSYHFLLL